MGGSLRVRGPGDGQGGEGSDGGCSGGENLEEIGGGGAVC